MLKKSTLRLSVLPLLVLTLLGSRPVAAQTTTYGNEWVQPGQTYYKIKVGQRGIHRLTTAWLTAAGLPVGTLDPRKLQIWRRGQQQALYVAGEADGHLDAADYVDFWGLPNDGRLDDELFKDRSEQTSHLAPIYTDTAAYFLTLAPQNGRRMPTLNSTTTGLTPLRHHLSEGLDVQKGFYYIGRNYGQIFLPWLDGPEGYFSPLLGTTARPATGVNSFPDPTITMPATPDTTHLVPQLEVGIIGCGFDPVNFEIRLIRGSGTTATVIRTLGAYTLSPFNHIIIKEPLRYADFNTGGVLRYRVVVTNAGILPYPFISVAYGRVRCAGKNALARASLLLQTDSTLTGPSQYLLFDTPPTSTVAYDVTDINAPTRITGQTTGTQWGVVVPTPGATTRRVFVANDGAPLTPGAPTMVQFRALQPQPGAYLIVTSSRLLADTLGNHPVRDYANYRASAVGGGYDTVVVTVQQLYDQFHYGDRSPNAIRRFARFMNSGSAPAGYLFLLGKGYQPSHLGSIAGNRRFFDMDMVPACGAPASDVLFTADFQNNHNYPEIPTGRIAAQTPADIAAYLAKVQQHEALGPAPWRKEVLHLGGGKTNGEQRQFSQYLINYASRVEDSVYFGGHVSSILRGNSGQLPIGIDVSSQVNSGLTLMTFFGHSSPSVSDIDVGLASNPINNYNNTGKYPMLLMNGCASGNAFLTDYSFGEDWVLARQRGAIAFMAHAGEGAPGYLNKYSGSFYATAFNDPNFYGKPLGDIQKQTVRRCADSLASNDPLAQAQLTEMVLQADPAVRLYSPDRPDYYVADTMVSVRAFPGERVTARSDSFRLAIKVRNFGKAINKLVRVQVKRSIGAAPPVTTDSTFRPIYYGDTIFYTLRNPVGGAAQGLNTFDVFVDWPDSVQELDETNNRARIVYNFPAGSVFPLYPPEFAIVTSNAPALTGQFDQPLTGQRPYTFELDTVPTFASSGSAHQTATVTGGRFPIWIPTLPATGGRDSVVWYWRFRPQVIQTGEDSTWATSSFRHIAVSPGGWSQSHYGQFARDPKSTLSQAAPSGKWTYSPATLHLELRTVTGAGNGIKDTATFEIPPNGIIFNQSNRTKANCYNSIPNFMLMVFDPRTFEPLKDSPTGSRIRCGQEGNPGEYVVYHAVGDTVAGGGLFGIVNVKGVGANRRQYVTARVDSLTRFINSVPNGYIVAVVSMNRVPFQALRANKPAFIAALQGLGSVLIADTSLHDGDPFLLVGVKGGAPGTASERTYNHSQPRARQQVVLTTNRTSNVAQGSVTSTVVGPAQQWQSLLYTLKPVSTTSSYKLNVVPIDANGHDGPVVPVTAPSNAVFNLAGISATQYPKLRLELSSQDTLNRQAPQLKQWVVSYVGVPEGVVRAELLTPAQLDLSAQAERGSIHLAVPFQNIAPIPFSDSLTTEFTVLQLPSQSVVGTPVLVKSKVLAPNTLDTIPVRIATGRFTSGDYLLRANVNPNNLLPEQYLFNNLLEVPFRIVNPNMAPLVDVAFDGQHILNGDIVAPAPVVTVSVRDEDHQQPIPADSLHLKLILLRPGQTTGTPVDITNGQLVQIHPATGTRPLEITYQPGRLPDGRYKLSVNAADANGNWAGNPGGDNRQYYEVEFTVINEAMISNFYPYPNPFSTSTRFLFTITGKIPQHLKVQIMTVTGRVVREITKEELGTDLRVGNNLSTATWDGTDEYGDKLANGVYLYRVVVQDDGDEFKTYKTAGDSKAFNKGWGKLYILR